MKNAARKMDSLIRASAHEIGESSLVERMFYIDCDPAQAIERTKRVADVAKVINGSKGFGSFRGQELIREAFQNEIESARNPIEALGRMNKLMALINLQLNSNLKLGPTRIGVTERLYLINHNAPTQNLELHLRFAEFGKNLSRTTKSFISAA
jgi:hypothetical protein